MLLFADLQGVYYASETSAATPSFVCSPGSHDLWPAFSESDANPSKQGDRLLNYLPLTAFDDGFVGESGLAPPVRVHAPARSLLLWNSRTCHGNAPPTETASGDRLGRVSLAVCYGPVEQRTKEVQKDTLVKALGAVRTTHHTAVMLSHNKQGYPVDWTAEAEYEPNRALRPLVIDLNPDVTESEFQQMITRSELTNEDKFALAATVNLGNLRERTYKSYWGIDQLTERDCYEPMLRFQTADLRRLIHPRYSQVQGLHSSERQR